MGLFKAACAIAVVCLVLGHAPGAVASDKNDKDDELTLERLFPEDGVFGPSAQQVTFAPSGRYAAYRWRPNEERRHGSDLWIYDAETGETRRVTSVSVMSQFQESARKVREDRIKKAKERKEEASEKGPDDGISGVWDGLVREAPGEGRRAPGIGVELVLRLGSEGAVTGEFRTSLDEQTIGEGTYSKRGGELTLVIEAAGGAPERRVEAKVDGGSLEGTLREDGRDAEFKIRATWTDPEGENGEDIDDLDEDRLADRVGKDDADDDDAPRYAGISTYVWAQHAPELIFTAGGNLFRYEVEEDRIMRLTATRETERDVQYLPDGSGYTYMRGDSLLKVRFDDHRVVQLDPELPSGERMAGYRISPDGRRLVFIAHSGRPVWESGRIVNIVQYRDRFATVRQVRRSLDDDPWPEFERSIYLYKLTDSMAEKGQLKKVYSRKQAGPRDMLLVPEWSPDSTRVAFSVFEQGTGHVEIREARFVRKEKEETDDDADNGDDPEDASGAENGSNDNDNNNGDGDNGDGAGSEEEDACEEDVDETDAGDEYEIEEARIVYRFLHNGGPNTPGLIHPRYLPDSRRTVFLTELSGFRHLHVLDPVYEQLEQITSGRHEVYPFEISPDHRRIFVTATYPDPTQQHVFTVDLETGERTKLTSGVGYFDNPAVSPDGEHVLANLMDYGLLRELVALSPADEGTPRVLTDSHSDEARKLTEPVPEFFTYENRHGQSIHGHMFKPPGWTPEDNRPLMIYVYGGPLSARTNMVSRGTYTAQTYFFAYYMAKKHGYVTTTIDPRGSSGYGALFEKANFERVGVPQVEDLVDGVRWFIDNHGVDPDRVGLHGWSFGGFQTQMCMYTEPDVFAAGIAGAGPTEWENYNRWYSTGTIGSTSVGAAKDLEEFSLLPLAKNLKGKLLLVHGMEDANVLYQDTVRVYRELLKAGHETKVELFLDPTGGHGLGGDIKTLNRYRKFEDFFLRRLGTGEPAGEPETERDEDERAEAGDADRENDEERDDDAPMPAAARSAGALIGARADE